MEHTVLVKAIEEPAPITVVFLNGYSHQGLVRIAIIIIVTRVRFSILAIRR
jgi:hypothetical protein